MQSSSRPSHDGGSVVDSPPWLAELVRRLGGSQVSTQPEDLQAYRRDMWARGLLQVAAGQPAGVLPAAVCWPRRIEDVQQVVTLAAQQKVKLTPFGAGSGVTGGAMPDAGGLVVDCKKLRSLTVDRDRMTVTCGAGWNGWHLEEALNRQGLSIGHFPSSIMCSTVGGWLATRGAGQMSTKYGKIEDMVSSLTVVTGTGERLTVDGTHKGPDWVQLFVGSEGRLGFLCEATLSLVAVPQKRLLRGYWFPDVQSGCGAIAQILGRGLRPAVVRLYDELDTLLAGTGKSGPSLNQPLFTNLSGTAGRILGQLSGLVGKFELGRSPRPLELGDLLALLRPDAERAKHRLERWLVQAALQKTEPMGQILDSLLSRLHVGCLLIIGCEGEPTTTVTEEQLIRDEIARLGGRDLGPEPGEHWLRHRYDVSFKWPKAFAAGAMADTMEFAATWDRLPALYQKVRAATLPHALIMAHFSHAYPDGCSIYFTFMTRALSAGADAQSGEPVTAQLRDDQRRYDEIWQGAIEAALAAGATIGHHHGVGRLRAPFLVDEQGEGLPLLRTLSKVCDPAQVLNPGRLFVEDRTVRPRQSLLLAPKAVTVNRTSLLVTVPVDLTLLDIEERLHKDELSLGHLPPSAYGRTLRDALLAPQPLEASVSTGRLHDRRVQLLFARKDGQLLAVPPQPAPRRSTGPDLGQLLSLWDDQVTLVGATLRVERHLPVRPTLTLGFDDSQAALRAILLARRWHGGCGVHSVQLLSRALCESLWSQDGDRAPWNGPSGRWLVVIDGAGPITVAQESMRELAHRLGAQNAWLPIPALRELVAAPLGAMCARWQALGPLVQRHLPALPLADLAQLLDRLPDRVVLGGTYRHGLAVGSPDATLAACVPDVVSPTNDLNAALASALALAGAE